MSSDALLWIAVGILLLTAAFLALAETSLTRMSRIKAVALQEQGYRGASRLVRLTDNPERFLNPVLLLVLVCHLMAATLVGVLAERSFGATGVAVAGFLEIVVVFVLCEAAPKTWAVQHPERAALIAAPLVSAIVAFPPVRFLTSGLIGLSNVILPGKGLRGGPASTSEEELLAMADAAVDEDVIEREERALIHAIIEFGDTIVREVMVPRPDMIIVEADQHIGEVIELAMSKGYSRLPVIGENVDDIVGIAYTKDLMRSLRDGHQDVEVRNVVRKPNFVPESKNVDDLMREMQRQKFHMAIVIDEYGGVAGLVTLEDLIEELVGEIVDEYDVEEPLMEPLPNGDYRVNARMPIDEVNDLVHVAIPEGDWDTVGGFLMDLLGHVPSEGEAVDHDGHRLVAEKVKGRRIGRVRISKLAQDVPAEDESIQG